MSRTTRNINQITQELDRISGLDGIVADKMENLADEVHSIVEEILSNHSKASLFDYYGNGKSGLSNVLDEIEKEPTLDEIVIKGNVIISKEYLDGETNLHVKYQIIKYNHVFYFTEFNENGYTVFRRLR